MDIITISSVPNSVIDSVHKTDQLRPRCIDLLFELIHNPHNEAKGKIQNTGKVVDQKKSFSEKLSTKEQGKEDTRLEPDEYNYPFSEDPCQHPSHAFCTVNSVPLVDESHRGAQLHAEKVVLLTALRTWLLGDFFLSLNFYIFFCSFGNCYPADTWIQEKWGSTSCRIRKTFL